MGCRGVLFAIAEKQVKELLAAESDDEIMEFVEAIEEAWDEDHLAELDKAWDAMHRALSDGTLDNDGGEPPLNLALLGGKHLYEGDDYVVVLVDADKVPDVAKALAGIDESVFRERYFQLVPKDYAPEYGEEDFDYTWSNVADVVTLYQRAAREDRAVVFTVDQ